MTAKSRKKENGPCDISVIVPLYYGQKYLPGLICSIETCARMVPEYRIELVLANDAPKEPIERKDASPVLSIKVINTDRNRGIHGARIRGFLASTGNYIVFLDQDDKLAPEYFLSQLKALGSAQAAVCSALSDGKPKYNLDRPLQKAICKNSMITEGNTILSPGQVLLRREAVPERWLNNPLRQNGADDWFLWLCMHAENQRFVMNPNVLFMRTIHYQNASFDSRKMAASEQEVVEIIEREQLLSEEERKNLRNLLPKLQERRIIENQKWKKMFFLLNDWFRAHCQGITVAGYLKEQGIKRAAIYGYGYLGKTLHEILNGGSLEIPFVIDKNAAYFNLPNACPLKDVPRQLNVTPIEAVIVTTMTENRQKMNAEIQETLPVKILWLEDLITDLAAQRRKEG